MRPVDSAGDLVELVLEGAVEDGHPRRDLLSEDARVQATEAANRAEAVVLATGERHRACPVGLDPELPGRDPECLSGGGEDDRRTRRRGRALFERPRCLPRGHPADLNPRNLDAFRDAGRRARERESDEDDQRDPEHREDGAAAQHDGAASTAARDRAKD